MAILEATLRRIALDQASPTGLLEQLSGEKLKLWQGVAARIEFALFNDTPDLTTLVSDVSNIDSISLVVRKNGPNGAILFTKEVVAGYINPSVTYAGWTAGTQDQFTFDINEVDTTQIVPDSGRLSIYWVVIVTNTSGLDYIAGFGYGEIQDVGYIDNPSSVDTVTGRTPIVGGLLQTDLDLNGHDIVDSTLPGRIESGEVALTAGQLEGDVLFQFPKTTPANLRFSRLYVADPNTPAEAIQAVVGVVTSTDFHFSLSAGPDTANSIFYWKVEPKDYDAPVVSPAPRYVEYNPNLLIKLASFIWLEDFESGEFDGVRDNAPALADAVAAAPRASIIRLPQNAQVYLAGPTHFTQPMILEGFGTDYSGTQVKVAAGITPFIVDNNVNSVEFRDFRLESLGDTRTPGSCGIKAIATSLSTPIGLLKVTNCVITGFERGIDGRFCVSADFYSLKCERNAIGLYLKRCVNPRCFGGDLSSNTLWGTHIDGDTGQVQQSCGMRFIGTRITNNGSGGGGNAKVSFNDQCVFDVCIIDVPAAGNVVGVRVEGCTGGGVVAGTYVGQASGPGVLAQDCADFIVSDSFIVGNLYGVRFLSCQRNKIKGNEIKDSAGFDVWINNESGTISNANIVEGNTLASAPTIDDESIFEQDINNTVVRNNVIAGKLSVQNPALTEGNYNYVSGLSADQLNWIAPTLQNSWVNYGSGETNAGYYLDPRNWVRIQGTIKDGSMVTNAILFILPVGYRPSGNKRFTVVNNDMVGLVSVNTAGEVRLASAPGGNTQLSLDGIAFRND